MTINLKNNRSEQNGGDGFNLPAAGDVVAEGNVASANKGHGFNLNGTPKKKFVDTMQGRIVVAVIGGIILLALGFITYNLLGIDLTP